MPVVKLKEVPQELWLGDFGYSKDGVCFYMAEYVEQAIWPRGSYDDLQTVTKNAVPVAIINAAKAKNLGDRDRAKMFREWEKYDVLEKLQEKAIYRIALWFGKQKDLPPLHPQGQNHAAVVAVGPDKSVIFFEPNFGFYKATDPNIERKVLLEKAISGLYGTSQIAANFTYLKGRKLS